MSDIGSHDVIPSHFAVSRTSGHYDGGVFSNTMLRIGEVKEIVYPDDKRSLSKKFIEYRVLVQHRSNDTAVTRMYEHCVLINPLAGFADKATFTLRENPVTKDKKQTEGLGYGSKVLLLCINGESSNAIIIGGVRDSHDATEEKDKAHELGHHMLFEFNGMEVNINKDGELIVTYKGKTTAKGELDKDTDENVTGTSFGIAKDGTFGIGTREDKQTYALDHTSKTIETKADTGWNLQVSDGNCTIKSAGTLVGDATDYWLLASTYRKNEQQFHSKLTAQLGTVQGLLTAAGAAITAASGPLAVPIVGGALASPLLAPAGVSLTNAAVQIGQMVAALQAFEAQASSYLSTKNKND